MYKCKHFKIQELVHPNLLKTIPEETLWKMFDARLLRAADDFRDKYGSIFINGRGLVDCGLREMNSSTGALYSPHKLGRALDLHIVSIEDRNLSKEDKINEYNKIRQDCLREDCMSSCISFENNVSWLHIDTYNRAERSFNK